MSYDLRRPLVVATLALGVLFGVGAGPAAAEPVPAPLVQTVQYYGPGPGYYRGPPPGYYRHRYYGRPYYGRPVYGPRPGFYGPRPGFYRHHGPYGRRFYR